MFRTACALLLTSLFALESVAATVSLEIAAAARVQPTAHREWLQLLARAGVNNVRVRSARSGDKPAINTLGRESYQVIGVLSSANKLTLPGGAFGRRDLNGLRDYFDRLLKDGPERQTAETGNFGLTRDEFEAVFRDLGRATRFPTAGLTVDQLLANAGKTLRFEIAHDPAARLPPAQLPPARLPSATDAKVDGAMVSDELSGLTIGVALAIALRGEGLALVPEKPRGKAIRYRVAPAGDKLESWPVGYKPEARPREVAPAIMEFTNVEIDGYKLREVIDVIGPRLKVPVLWDTAALEKHKIDPAAVDVKLAPSRRTYKSILGKLLIQARLHGELRVDEAGTAFYWITK